jgi:hypothetical protein
MLTAPSTILSFPASAGFVFQDDELIFILVTSKDPGIRCERDLDLIKPSLAKTYGVQDVHSSPGCAGWTDARTAVDLCCGHDASGSLLTVSYRRKGRAFDPAKHAVVK